MEGQKNKEDSWLKHYWRPLMAYQYMVVCIFDFIIGPIINFIFFYKSAQIYIPWEPVTLQVSGFYHIAMGGIVGISAWTRGMFEKKKLDE